MKKVIYLFALVAAVFTGCNPLEDINAEIDALPDEPNIGVFEYTLIDADYERFDLSFGNFGSEVQAKDSIPFLLNDLYPLYGEGSSVLVNYDLFVGSAEGLGDLTGADTYQLTNDDYALTGSDAFGFYPNVDPTNEIPDVLAAQIADPVDGQLVLATYKQYFETPEIGFANFYENPFPETFSSYENIAVSGDFGGWSEGDAHANGSAFNGSNNDGEHWLISPEIDLTGAEGLKFQINQRISFLNGFVASDYITIQVSIDYTTGGDPMMATWDVITLETVPSGDTSDFVLSENYNFSAYDNALIHIAFKYEPTVESAPLWRIDYFNIQTTGVTGDTDTKGEYFAYDGGSWEEAEDVYYLSNSDYDSMGESNGQPGAFNNFSSSTRADDYLPTFLTLKYPFAQEEDELFVIYKYFSSNSGAGIRGDFYTFLNGSWTASESVISTALQFGFSDGEWVPDNTIRYMITADNFDYIATNYATTTGFEAAVASMANFGNFDRRPTNDAFWSDDMILTVFGDLLNTSIAPGAADDQKYVISVAIYDGSNGIEDFSLIKTAGEWVYNVE